MDWHYLNSVRLDGDEAISTVSIKTIPSVDIGQDAKTDGDKD